MSNLNQNLKQLLANTYTLYLQTHNFHWNVRGIHFAELHLLWEKQYQELALAADEIAERIRALGELAPGTFEEFIALSSIKQHQGDLNAKAMIKKLLDDHQALIKTSQTLLKSAEGDDVTVDLATQRLTYHEKTAWMLRSLLED